MSISDTTSSSNRPSDKLNLDNGNGKVSNGVTGSATTAGEDLAGAAKAGFNNILSDLQELVRRASKLSGQELTTLREQMSEKLDVARERLSHLSEDASTAAHRGVDSTEQLIKQHPLQAVGIAAVVGIAIGVLLNRH